MTAILEAAPVAIATGAATRAPRPAESAGTREAGVAKPRETGVAKPRLAWIDTARGFIMLAVVVLHVGLYQYLPLTAARGGAAHDFWTTVNNLLGAIRMPALLVISGWLASSTLRTGLFSARTRKRIASNGYLFVLWMGIYAVLTTALHAESAAQAVPLHRLLSQLLLPDSTLWFLAALVWYTIALSAARRLPSWSVLVALLVLAALADTFLPTTLGLWVKIPQFALYFALGAYAKPVWAWIAEHPAITLPLGAFATWGAIQWENYQTLTTQQWSFPSATLVSLAMAITLFSVAGAVARYLPLAAKPFALVGRNTVAVYVLHFPVLLLMTYVPALHAIPTTLLAYGPVLWAYPVALALVITMGSLGVRAAADRLGARWLFALPKINLPHFDVVLARA